MSYRIYTTDGIILKRAPFGEANALLYILTEDLGLIIASAQAVRTEKSKLRSSIQEYTEVSVSCVKGKNGWKLTNVTAKNNFFFDLSSNVARIVLARVVAVLIKMIQGESVHPEVFHIIRTGFEFLKNLETNQIADFEALVMLRILSELGYVAVGESVKEFLTDRTEWNSDILKKVSENRVKIVEMINRGLKESQL